MANRMKIVSLGNDKTGKTAYLNRYVSGQFGEKNIFTTIQKDLTRNNENYVLTLWDHNDRIQSVFKIYMMGAIGALLFFDLTRLTTFNNLNKWIDLIRNDYKNGKDLPIVLVGTKCDLEESVDIDEELINNFVKDNNLIGYFATSSKTGQNIDESMEFLLNAILENMKNKN